MKDKIQVTFYSKKIKPPFENSYFDNIKRECVNSLDELKEFVVEQCNNILENNIILEELGNKDKDLYCKVIAELKDECGCYVSEYLHFYMVAEGNVINNKFYWQITYSEPFS